MTLLDRDALSADALLTDLYLDALLADAVLDRDSGPLVAIGDDLDPAARRAADRLRRDLARVHPSFRFEERLATRLAEAATAMQAPGTAVGARVIPIRPRSLPADLPGFEVDDDRPYGRDRSRPLLIGGALTSAALSLAGAAFVAWRRGRPGGRTTAMARAVRQARRASARTATGRGSRQRSATRSARGLD
jgi:hypothetical protein